MSDIKRKEKILLIELCREHKVPFSLVEQILKDAELFSYQKTTDSTRSKQYGALINHHFSKRNEGK
ncbi:hypothetical protein [Psychrobacillus sp. NPDC093200]|uniref:hypothetical protein n=1 Tax=Psychrobacillus sp. NPDC093200 TaxID=3390656 RepID=UPI003D0453A8